MNTLKHGVVSVFLEVQKTDLKVGRLLQRILLFVLESMNVFYGSPFAAQLRKDAVRYTDVLSMFSAAPLRPPP